MGATLVSPTEVNFYYAACGYTRHSCHVLVCPRPHFLEQKLPFKTQEKRYQPFPYLSLRRGRVFQVPHLVAGTIYSIVEYQANIGLRSAKYGCVFAELFKC